MLQCQTTQCLTVVSSRMKVALQKAYNATLKKCLICKDSLISINLKRKPCNFTFDRILSTTFRSLGKLTISLKSQDRMANQKDQEYTSLTSKLKRPNSNMNSNSYLNLLAQKNTVVKQHVVDSIDISQHSKLDSWIHNIEKINASKTTQTVLY